MSALAFCMSSSKEQIDEYYRKLREEIDNLNELEILDEKVWLHLKERQLATKRKLRQARELLQRALGQVPPGFSGEISDFLNGEES